MPILFRVNEVEALHMLTSRAAFGTFMYKLSEALRLGHYLVQLGLVLTLGPLDFRDPRNRVHRELGKLLVSNTFS